MSFLQNSPARTVIAAAALAAGALGAPRALAQCDVYRPGLPDFDQRRAGLPNNGAAHCVPTSAADAIAYITNHGAPELMLGATPDWTNPATYNLQTTLIDMLGTLMGTDGGGTDSDGFVNGLTAFFDARAPGEFIASTIHWSNGVPPSPNAVRSLMLQGAFPLIVRGVYEPEQAHPGILHRVGGHIMLARNAYDTCGASPELGMRDPNTPGGESLFVNSPWAVYREGLHLFEGTFRLWNGTTQQRTYWKWSHNWAPQTKLLDGILVIMPTFAVSGVLIEGEEAGINIMRPTTLAGPIQTSRNQFLPLPSNLDPITSLDIMPDLTSAVVVTGTHAGGGGGGAGKVSMQDFFFPYAFHEGPDFTSEIVDTCTSPGGEIYVTLANEHVLLSSMMQRIGSIRNGNTALASAYDDAGHVVKILGRGSSGPVLQSFPPDLSSGPLDEQPCPPNVVIEGPASMSVDPDGVVLLCSEGVPVIYRLEYDALGRLTAVSIPLPPDTAPRNVQAGSPNRLLYTNLDTAVELERNANGAWDIVRNAPFSGFTVGRSFALAAGRDGMSSGERTGPDISNIADEALGSVPDCAADFNDDGTANSQDFFDFLTAFFDRSPSADFNDNNSLDSQDFFDFLTAFFRGC